MQVNIYALERMEAVIDTLGNRLDVVINTFLSALTSNLAASNKQVRMWLRTEGHLSSRET